MVGFASSALVYVAYNVLMAGPFGVDKNILALNMRFFVSI